MKKWLIEQLICPECLCRSKGAEIPLKAESHQETAEEIIDGKLVCRDCGQTYEIKEGVATVVPVKTLPITKESSGYGSFSMLSSYLWSHFCDFLGEPEATDAYRKWANQLQPGDGWALDIGCSVGRLTFDMSTCHTRAVGIDTSHSFIAAARQLADQKRLDFEMVLEGRITESRSCPLETNYAFDNSEFIVADAMALPFRKHSFVTASSVNILEKVPDPYRHLVEANRVMQPDRAQFLFSDPFSWDESVNGPECWLGGTRDGKYQGFGIDIIRSLLQALDGPFAPGFKLRNSGSVNWKIRKTRHLWEHITSLFVIAERRLG